MTERVYLDHAATTAMHPAAREAWLAGIERWANPSSPHVEGRAARAALEDSRARIAAALGWNGTVLFTSGSSEAIAMAMAAAPADRRAVSPVEHEAVLRAAGTDAHRLAVDLEGRLVIASIARLQAQAGAGAWFAIQHVNSETGVIQPVEAIAAAVAEAAGTWLCDASQSAGRLPLPPADLVIVSAHKLGGPPGIGALLVRDLALLRPSGGQERGYRPGTENLPGALAFAAALETLKTSWERTADLRTMLDRAITGAGGEIVAAGAERLPTIGSYRMPGVAASAQLIQFDLAGIAVSAGSACSSGTLRASHVLGAMGWDDQAAGEVVRASFGAGTSRADVYRFIEEWRAIAGRARARAAGAAA